MSEKQQATVDFIREYTEEQGYAPSQADIAQWFGVTQQAAGQRIERLERKGFVRRTAGVPRSVRVVTQQSSKGARNRL